jgi:hypothetical protein
MKYRVKRQDDNGHIFEASGWYETHMQAMAAKDRCEAYSHKQMYWVEDEEGKRADVRISQCYLDNIA